MKGAVTPDRGNRMDPVPRHGITRRSALALSAAGIATLATGGPAAAASATPIEGFSVGPDAFGADGLSAPLRAASRFGLLGVLDPRTVAGLQVRTRRDGLEWGRWMALHAGHAPDGKIGRASWRERV